MAQSQLNFDPRHVVDADMSMASKPPFKAEAQVGARARLGLAAVIAGFCLYAALLGAGWWATLHLLPDQLSGRVGGHVMILKNIHHRIAGDGMLLFALLPFALWLECAHTGWETSSLRKLLSARTQSTKTDLAVFILGQTHVLNVVGKVTMLGASMLSGAWIYDKLHSAFGYTINAAVLPLPAQVAIYFFLYTFFDYWTHRLDHSRYFWPLHRFHHSADEFCVLTAGREHPAAFTSVFFINLPLAVLGAPPAAMLYVNVVVIALGFLIQIAIASITSSTCPIPQAISPWRRSGTGFSAPGAARRIRPCSSASIRRIGMASGPVRTWRATIGSSGEDSLGAVVRRDDRLGGV
jgi:hypothetical protein